MVARIKRQFPQRHFFGGGGDTNLLFSFLLRGLDRWAHLFSSLPKRPSALNDIVYS